MGRGRGCNGGEGYRGAIYGGTIGFVKYAWAICEPFFMATIWGSYGMFVTLIYCSALAIIVRFVFGYRGVEFSVLWGLFKGLWVTWGVFVTLRGFGHVGALSFGQRAIGYHFFGINRNIFGHTTRGITKFSVQFTHHVGNFDYNFFGSHPLWHQGFGGLAASANAWFLDVCFFTTAPRGVCRVCYGGRKSSGLYGLNYGVWVALWVDTIGGVWGGVKAFFGRVVAHGGLFWYV